MSAEQPKNHRGVLPDVSDETLERIEGRVFAAIAADRGARPPRARRRRRAWLGAGVAAAIVAVAAVLSPAVLQGLGGGGASSVGDSESAAVAPGSPGAPPASSDEATDAAEGGGTLRTEDGEAAETAPEERAVIRTGSASIVVDDPRRAADAVVRLADEHGGWVEQLSIGTDRSFSTAEETGDAVWVPEDGGFVSIRVPADALDAVIAALDDIGDMSSTRVDTQDATSQAVDLRARIDAARASVERLTELLAQSGSVGDLVQVETALSQRQAELESLEQQLASLEGQVAMASLSVSLLAQAPPVEPDPAGFGDGLEAGWNGLLTALNAIVIALGFLLPWLALAAAVWLAVWAARRLGRRRRRVPRPSSEGGDADGDVNPL
jgi:hypothetical protein